MQSLRLCRPHLHRNKLISRSAVCVPLPGKAFQVLRKICQGCRSKCVPCLVSVGPRWKVNCGMKRAQQFGLQFLSAKVKGDGKSPRKGPSTSLSGDWRYVGKIRQPCCSWTAKRVLAGCIILVLSCACLLRQRETDVWGWPKKDAHLFCWDSCVDIGTLVGNSCCSGVLLVTLSCTADIWLNTGAALEQLAWAQFAIRGTPALLRGWN